MFVVKKQLAVQGDGASWSVPDDMVKTVDGLEFVKLQPSRNYGFIRLVLGKKCSGSDSLSHVCGYQQLQKLRADKESAEPADPAASLFEVHDEKPAKKKRSAKAKAPKGSQEVLVVDADGTAIKILSAMHPSESVWVEASGSSISATIAFIRSHGLQAAEAEAAAKLEPGQFRMGGGRVATKTGDGKLKYIKQ